EEPFRHAVEAPAVEDLRPGRVAAELAQLRTEPDPLAQRDARRLLRHERVGSPFEEEFPVTLGADLSAGALVRFENDDGGRIGVRPGPLDQPVRGRQARDTAADDDNGRYRSHAEL